MCVTCPALVGVGFVGSLGYVGGTAVGVPPSQGGVVGGSVGPDAGRKSVGCAGRFWVGAGRFGAGAGRAPQAVIVSTTGSTATTSAARSRGFVTAQV
ncbi:hypothetical protein GCM10027290_42060 [Micromonospora sonneratiae]